MAREQTARKREASGGGDAASRRGGRTAGAGGAPAARDETYGLVSVLYHALQGAETYGTYLEDAQRSGDAELAQFFEDCRDQENERALLAKQLLAMRLADESDEDEDEDEADEEE
jgi:hypothetical protein